MNCYVLPDLRTVLLLRVRSIAEWKIGYRVFMACFQRVYTEFICYRSLWPTVQNVQPNALCQRSERNEMWEYQRYIWSVLNIVAHICNEYLKELKYRLEIHIVKRKDIKLHRNGHSVLAFDQNYTDVFIIIFLVC
jgi:hypothetical protein